MLATVGPLGSGAGSEDLSYRMTEAGIPRRSNPAPKGSLCLRHQHLTKDLVVREYSKSNNCIDIACHSQKKCRS